MLSRIWMAVMGILLMTGLAWSETDKPLVIARASVGGVLDPNVVAVGDWSEEVDGFCGRLVVVRGRVLGSGPVRESVLYLELRHSSLSNKKEIYFDPNMECILCDAHDKPVTQSPGAGSGGQPGPEWITLPYDCSMRLRLSPYGFGSADGLLLITNRSQWLVKANDAAAYFLSGTFVSEPPKDAGRDNAWKGTLKVPAVKIVMAGA